MASPSTIVVGTATITLPVAYSFTVPRTDKFRTLPQNELSWHVSVASQRCRRVHNDGCKEAATSDEDASTMGALVEEANRRAKMSAVGIPRWMVALGGFR
jgi:hypothetical protein